MTNRVKFGVGLDQVCLSYNDIPAPLLILILKLNKEAPTKKDVFRAPGHQANMKKLINVLQVHNQTEPLLCLSCLVFLRVFLDVFVCYLGFPCCSGSDDVDDQVVRIRQ